MLIALPRKDCGQFYEHVKRVVFVENYAVGHVVYTRPPEGSELNAIGFSRQQALFHQADAIPIFFTAQD